MNTSTLDLDSFIKRPLGESQWLLIDQPLIDRFAEITLDTQAIHIDPKLAAQGPFASTIAHGLLSLSLVPHLLYPLLHPVIPQDSTLINYGIDKLRFIQAVKSDSKIRCNANSTGCEKRGEYEYLLRLNIQIEIQNESKPAIIADILTLLILNSHR